MADSMYSYSRVSAFKTCPAQYKYHYIDKLVPIQDNEADNALIIGSAMHAAIEGSDNWKNEYLSQLNISSDSSEEEIYKIDVLSAKVREWLQKNFVTLEFEREIRTPKGFIGYIDCIAIDDDGKRWIIDFKYSNSSYYLKSPQVHIYKWVLENVYHECVDEIAYLLIPKIKIRKKKTETTAQFRRRLSVELDDAKIEAYKVGYESNLIREFVSDVACMQHATEFEKAPNKLCDWCDYKILCTKGEDAMLIPKNEKVAIAKDTLKKVYIYGAPFSGKTFLANQFPDALLINSDGNTKYVDSPRIHICDTVEMNGRIEKRTLAWDMFKTVITEIEQGNGKEYKTLVVDLLEDMYEFCRLYMYDKLKITHESDDNFGAWDKVRTEFLSTIKRLVALPYNIVLLSQEDTTRDITKRAGDKVTAIMPALPEKVARKVSGMVDIVLRIVNNNGARTLQNRPSDVVFGGGRLSINNGDYPCTIDSINDMYNHVTVVKEGN